MKMCHNIVFSE